MTVISTSEEGTREALRVATALAASASSKLLVYIRSGDHRCVVTAKAAVETTVFAYSGRPEDLAQLVPKSAPVVVGGSGGLWWPSREQQLAIRFADLGYRVVFALAAKS